MLKEFFKKIGFDPKWGNVSVPEDKEAPKETEISHKKPGPGETEHPRKEKDK